MNLTHLRQVVRGILYDVESAPDAMGEFISEELQLLEARVCEATVQSLEVLDERLRDAGRSDFPEHHRSISE